MTMAVLLSVSPSNNLLHKCYTINKNYGKLMTGMSLTIKCSKQPLHDLLLPLSLSSLSTNLVVFDMIEMKTFFCFSLSNKTQFYTKYFAVGLKKLPCIIHYFRFSLPFPIPIPTCFI